MISLDSWFKLGVFDAKLLVGIVAIACSLAQHREMPPDILLNAQITMLHTFGLHDVVITKFMMEIEATPVIFSTSHASRFARPTTKAQYTSHGRSKASVRFSKEIVFDQGGPILLLDEFPDVIVILLRSRKFAKIWTCQSGTISFMEPVPLIGACC